MDTQDKESLRHKVASGQHAVFALFDSARWDCQLVPIADGLVPDEVLASYAARGLRFAATLGFVGGKFCAAWEQPVPDDPAINFLSRMYCEWLYRELVVKAPTKLEADASIAWLKSLYQLSDPRKEN
jgi:hypothetical protein